MVGVIIVVAVLLVLAVMIGSALAFTKTVDAVIDTSITVVKDVRDVYGDR